MKQLRTIDDFINFFESIPEEKWTKRAVKRSGKCCAIGHFISQYFDDTTHKLLEKITVRALVEANDSDNHKSAKENVLQFLRELKEIDLFRNDYYI